MGNGNTGSREERSDASICIMKVSKLYFNTQENCDHCREGNGLTSKKRAHTTISIPLALWGVLKSAPKDLASENLGTI